MTEEPFSLLDYLKRAVAAYEPPEGSPRVAVVGSITGVAYLYPAGADIDEYTRVFTFSIREVAL